MASWRKQIPEARKRLSYQTSLRAYSELLNSCSFHAGTSRVLRTGISDEGKLLVVAAQQLVPPSSPCVASA